MNAIPRLNNADPSEHPRSPSVARWIEASIAACHSGAICSAFGNALSIAGRAPYASNSGLKFASPTHFTLDKARGRIRLVVGVLVMRIEHLPRNKQRRPAEPSLWDDENTDGTVSLLEKHDEGLFEDDERGDDLTSLLEENARLRGLLGQAIRPRPQKRRRRKVTSRQNRVGHDGPRDQYSGRVAATLIPRSRTGACGDADNRFVDFECGGTMSTIQAILLGMMIAWTSTLILLAYLLWREETRRSTDREAHLRSLFSGFDDANLVDPKAARKTFLEKLSA